MRLTPLQQRDWPLRSAVVVYLGIGLV
jgi:hypothetical protein